MAHTYVITGATGNTGSRIAKALLSRGNKVRAIARNADKLAELKAAGAETLAGNQEDVSFLAEAFKGADALYFMIPPNYGAADFRGYQNKLADAGVAALSRSPVKHVVSLSSIGAHLPQKAGVVQGLHDMEQKLNTLGDIHIVHLRPAYFMENLFGLVGVVKQLGILGSPVRADLSFPMVATQDIAEVAVRRLSSLDFEGRQIHYVLGPRDISFTEAAPIIGKALGKPDLSYIAFPYEEAKKAMMGMGLSESAATAMVEFVESMNEGRVMSDYRRTPDATTPTTLEQFVPALAGAASH